MGEVCINDFSTMGSPGEGPLIFARVDYESNTMYVPPQNVCDQRLVSIWQNLNMNDNPRLIVEGNSYPLTHRAFALIKQLKPPCKSSDLLETCSLRIGERIAKISIAVLRTVGLFSMQHLQRGTNELHSIVAIESALESSVEEKYAALQMMYDSEYQDSELEELGEGAYEFGKLMGMIACHFPDSIRYLTESRIDLNSPIGKIHLKLAYERIIKGKIELCVNALADQVDCFFKEDPYLFSETGLDPDWTLKKQSDRNNCISHMEIMYAEQDNNGREISNPLLLSFTLRERITYLRELSAVEIEVTSERLKVCLLQLQILDIIEELESLLTIPEKEDRIDVFRRFWSFYCSWGEEKEKAMAYLRSISDLDRLSLNFLPSIQATEERFIWL